MSAAAVVASVWALAAAPVHAHMRTFIFNQDYYTEEQGGLEVELFNDFNLTDLDNENTYDSKHQVELEYGLTNHVQIAVYEVFTWDEARREHWQHDQVMAELKYRLAEAGQWPVDVALYTEYKNPNGPRNTRSDTWENKLILGKTVGRVRLVTNLTAQKTINTHSDWQFSYTVGASHAFTPRVIGFLEYKESLGGQDDVEWFAGNHAQQLLPGIAIQTSEKSRLLIGSAIGLSSPANDIELKSIFQFEF
jgi:hypothetical protein